MCEVNAHCLYPAQANIGIRPVYIGSVRALIALKHDHDMAITSTLQALVLLACTWATWKVLKRLVLVDPLSVVPGPRPESFWLGECFPTHLKFVTS